VSLSPETPQGDSSTDTGAGPNSRPTQAAKSRPALIVAEAFVQTVRHFFPDLNEWFQAIPDTRNQDLIVYPTRFMVWWGILLYVLQLGSRRQLDFALDKNDPGLLHNLNLLPGTHQQ